MKKGFVLKSTGFIGDAILASALQKNLYPAHVGLISAPFILPLWDNLKNTSTYPLGKTELPEHLKLIDLGNYLLNLAHVSFARMHLCQLMAYEAEKSSLYVNCSEADVRVVLTEEEVRTGVNIVQRISQQNGNKPIVIITPYASTENKSLPRETLEEVVKGISSFAVPCLKEPFNKDQYIEGAVTIGHPDIRIGGPAVLLAADAHLTVDTGPLHMVNGAIQGTPEYNIPGTNRNKNKIIVALGSSHPDVVCYPRNRAVYETGGCNVSPCGAHYPGMKEKLEQRLGVKFHGAEKEGSLCIYPKYTNSEVSPCMKAVPAEKLIEELRSYLEKR